MRKNFIIASIVVLVVISIGTAIFIYSNAYYNLKYENQPEMEGEYLVADAFWLGYNDYSDTISLRRSTNPLTSNRMEFYEFFYEEDTDAFLIIELDDTSEDEMYDDFTGSGPEQLPREYLRCFGEIGDIDVCIVDTEESLSEVFMGKLFFLKDENEYGQMEFEIADEIVLTGYLEAEFITQGQESLRNLFVNTNNW